MTLHVPSLVLFLVALFFFANPASAQSVTFRTVRECVNYQYDMVVKSLCASSNQCNVNLCSPEYKSSDSYNQVVGHCETVMQAPPSVVEPLMQARCDQGTNHPSNKKQIGTIVGATIGGLIGLVVLGIVGTTAWHISVREVPLLTRMGMSSPFATQPARTLSHRDGARHVRRNQNRFMPPPIAPNHRSLPFSSFVSKTDGPLGEHRPESNIDQVRPVTQDYADLLYSPVTEHSSVPPTPNTITPLMTFPLSPSRPLDNALEYTPTRARYDWV